MTEQETFDIVTDHLRRQGRKAMYREGNYRYQTPGGLKCAIGCLIPQSRYQARFEGRGLYGELSDLMEELGHNLLLLSRLRAVHDENAPHKWERELADVAEDFDLICTPKTED